MMRHEVIRTAEALHRLEPQWTELLSRSGRRELPLTHLWVCAWWRHFGADSELRVHCFWLDERLVAAAPMMMTVNGRYRRVRLARESLNANGHSPFADILLDASLSHEGLLDVLKRICESSSADIVSMIRIPLESRVSSALTQGRGPSGRAIGLERNLRTPLVRVTGRWDDFFAAKSQKFRKGMRNKLNKFFKSPDFRVERIRLQSSAHQALAEMIDVSRRSWKAKVGTDLATLPGSLGFLKQLIDALGPRDCAEVWMAYRKEQPIAYELHLRYAGTTYPLRADIDEGFRDLSPGSVVEATALRQLFEEGAVELYDSCANDYWYLSNWTTEYREHLDIEIFGKSLRGNAVYLFEYRVVPVLRAIRDKLRKPTASAMPPASH